MIWGSNVKTVEENMAITRLSVTVLNVGGCSFENIIRTKGGLSDGALGKRVL